jgi:type I restriction enzyme S subunit
VGSVGRADRTVCLGRGVCAINSDNNDFLYYFFERNEPYWKRIEQGGTFTAISGDDIADMPIDYPSLEERQKIADFLLKIDTHIAVEENTLNQLVALKSGLLQQLFI